MKLDTIINNTPHDVVIMKDAKFIADVRKYMGGETIATIPSAGMLNAKVAIVPTDDVVAGIPTLQRKVTGVDPVPDDGKLHIVSAQYLAAVRELGGDTSRLLTVGPVVVNDDRRIVGVIGLVRN